MNSDIKLDAENDGWVTIESNVLKANSSDFMLDNSSRRTTPEGHRRALVHNEKDGLTVNFNGDYPGGVTIEGEVGLGGGVKIGGGARIEGDVRIKSDARVEGAAQIDGGLILGGRLRLRKVDAPGNALPRKGNVGDIIVVQNATIDPAALINDVGLWICIGKRIGIGQGDDVLWQRLSVGEPVAGTSDD
jgi:NDP-sugar pyrophosphorylase family protein